MSYGKVAEYQRRGVVHFHALIRLDQIDPTDPEAVQRPPSGIISNTDCVIVPDAFFDPTSVLA